MALYTRRILDFKNIFLGHLGVDMRKADRKQETLQILVCKLSMPEQCKALSLIKNLFPAVSHTISPVTERNSSSCVSRQYTPLKGGSTENSESCMGQCGNGNICSHISSQGKYETHFCSATIQQTATPLW